MKRMLMRKPFSTIMRGVTILEVMLAIAVGALVLIGAIAFYTIAKQNANVNKVVRDLTAITAAASQFLNTSTFSAGDTVGQLQSAGLLPATFKTPYGGAYTTPTYVAATGLVITINGITGTGNASCSAIRAQTGAGVTGSGVTNSSNATNCILTYTL